MQQQRVDIPSDILVWALERGGFGVPDIKNVPIADWLDGVKRPTVKQLQEFAKKVHVPFGFLFLGKPPVETFPIPFFRTNNTTHRIKLNVRDTVRDLEQRQEWLRSFLMQHSYDALSFVGKFNLGNTVNEIVADIRNTLGLQPNWASSLGTWTDALSLLTKKIEEQRIVVVFNGVVGNNTHRKIEVEDCRGFVLVDEYAPFLFVNNSDAKAAQMFTLIHELAHIWLGQSAAFDLGTMLPANDPIEKLCDAVAAEFLVPEIELRAQFTSQDGISELARHFKVSPIVIARRLLDARLITRTEFFAFYEEHTSKEFERRSTLSSGGDFYATAKKRISPLFGRFIFSAVNSGDLLYRDAYRLTGLKGNTFETFMNEHLG